MENSDQIPEKTYQDEIDEGRIIDNLHLLSLKLVRRDKKLDEATRIKLRAIQKQDMDVGREHVTQSHIIITYNTRTGQIGPLAEGAALGDYSMLRTILVENGDISPKLIDGRWVKPTDITRTILLYKPGDTPSTAAIEAALPGEENIFQEENRQIRPERVIPGHPESTGVQEGWGESQYADSARGDTIMLKTIQKFNQTYNPHQ